MYRFYKTAQMMFADAQALQAQCPDHARLNAQVNSMGIFGTTQVLDHFWRACRDAGMDTCAPLQAATSTPAPHEPAPVEAVHSCSGPITFTAQLESGGQQHE